MNFIKNMSLLILPFLIILPLTAAEIETTEEEVDNPSTPQELLEIVRQGQFADSQAQRKREQRFRSEKNKQTKLLADEKAERARLERIAKQLEVKFEANEALLVVAEAQLKENLGSLNEIFGHIAGTATEAREIFQESVTAGQFGKEREEFMSTLAKKMAEGIRLASISELETLWYELQREITAQGEVTSFSTSVIGTDGEVETREVVRVGVFNTVSDGEYLKYASTRGMYEELPSQPPGRYTSSTGDLFGADSFPVQFAIDPTGPQGGTYLSSLITMPGTLERMSLGGPIGTIILIVGFLTTLLFAWRFYFLYGVRKEINTQLESNTLASDNALGRVLKVAEDNKDSDTDTLELKMAEQILQERPPIEAWIWMIKLVSVVAPLGGLFGTIVGMIETFTMITLFGTGDPKTMAGGISVALVTTWLGLMVAIPTTFMHAIVNNYSKGILATIEEQSVGMVAERSESRTS
jgi:biopolymer transport protein ExbB